MSRFGVPIGIHYIFNYYLKRKKYIIYIGILYKTAAVFRNIVHETILPLPTATTPLLQHLTIWIHCYTYINIHKRAFILLYVFFLPPPVLYCNISQMYTRTDDLPPSSPPYYHMLRNPRIISVYIIVLYGDLYHTISTQWRLIVFLKIYMIRIVQRTKVPRYMWQPRAHSQLNVSPSSCPIDYSGINSSYSFSIRIHYYIMIFY